MDASYEKLGAFYLGKKFDLAGGKLLGDKICYDAKDLTTHAMCVGMTGSGKTGLCLALLEEAAIDGIPVIAIDPKGDLGNLLLTFPELAPSDFGPWLDDSEAARQGITLDELAQKTATTWRRGLEEWDQAPQRIAQFREAVDLAIYTPGSNAGLPMTVLRSFDAPPAEVVQDVDLFRERVAGAASGLLTLLGIQADPLTAPEHILLSTIFADAWSKGQNLELPSLIRLIQSPPFAKVGVFDLESFMPRADRMKLAMSLNNLLASPSFAGWLQGQPLDIRSLLFTQAGKPRVSILSIAHLSDSERMFFVTIFLNELLSWMRTQPGTSALRAVFAMDEIYGYFPPLANPPSKPAMILLLKQARAFGLGIVLATQNPADLDYKGLANIGTWFLGRLQTDRDKARVLDGLEGVSAHANQRFDRAAMERVLASLGSRVFLMNNVHDDGPTIFQTRWALSYLRGPLSRVDIQRLMDPARERSAPGPGAAEPNASASAGGADERATDVALQSNQAAQATSQPPASPTVPAGQQPMLEPASAIGGRSHHARPIVAADVPERFCRPSRTVQAAGRLIYRAALLGQAACHYVRASAGVDDWIDTGWLVLDPRPADDAPWSHASKFSPRQLQLSTEPMPDFAFDELPDVLLSARNYKRWQTQLKDFLYRHEPMRLYRCAELKATSRPGEDELDARLGFEQKLREARDAEKEKLQGKYAALVRALETKIQAAQERVDREGGQFYESALDFGQTVIGMILGNKRSRGSRTATTIRRLGKAARQRGESKSAQETLESLMVERTELIEQAERELNVLKDRFAIHSLELTPLDVPCRKSDTRVDLVALAWIPWSIGADGQATPLVDFVARS